MISYLKGIVVATDATSAVVEVGGIGYSVGMSTKSLERLPQVGKAVQVFTDMQVREDDVSLYGFVTMEERALFQRLIGVSGIGPKAALAALSTFDPAELTTAILREDAAAISRIPGVGKKTATRIILELKGSLEHGSGIGDAVSSTSSLKGATEALLSMGFSSAEAEVALRGAPEQADEAALLQYALKRLGS